MILIYIYIYIYIYTGNRWNKDKLVPYRELLDRIESRFGHMQKLVDDPNDTTKVIIYLNIGIQVTFFCK